MKEYFVILGHCLYSSFRHPYRPISPLANPLPFTQSPIPWWGSVTILIMGIISWCLSAVYQIESLTEAARAMVYLPLGNIFGMTHIITQQSKPPK